MPERCGDLTCRISFATAVVLVILCVSAGITPFSSNANDELTSVSTTSDASSLDPVRVVGHQKCVDCHTSEYKTWQKSHHATATFDMLRSGEYAEQSQEFAEELDIPLRDIARSSVCIRCHATPQIVDGRQKVLPGVSCEACHGAAGGEDGWLNRHAVYGPTGTPRELESFEQQQSRTRHCKEAGQKGVDSPFSLAVACYQCHVVWNEKLVNLAEHPSGSDAFEFASWSLGEVRHNYHLNQQENAIVSTLWANPVWITRQSTPQNRLRLMYVSGKTALLYVALLNRARATEEGDFADDMDTYSEDAVDDLRDIVIDYSDDDADTDKEYDPDDLPSIQSAIHAVDKALEAMEKIDEELDAAENLSDERKSEEFFRRTASEFYQAASLVKSAGHEFERKHDGSLLAIVDEDLPIISADPRDEDNEAHYSDYWQAANLDQSP